MNKRNRLIFIAVATIVAIACACPMTSLPTSGEPTSVSNIPLPTGNNLLRDDFSSDTGEWEVFSDGTEGSAEIANGVYAIRTFTNLWVWGRTDTEFSNTVVEIDATFTSGPSNNNAGAGVYCRLSLREDTSLDAYMLAISADGYYAILEFEAGSPIPLVDWTSTEVINQGYNATNSIRATCDGSQLILEVNGVELASTNTPTGGATSGYLSLAAVSFESAEPTAEVQFDNLIVSKP